MQDTNSFLLKELKIILANDLHIFDIVVLAHYRIIQLCRILAGAVEGDPLDFPGARF